MGKTDRQDLNSHGTEPVATETVRLIFWGVAPSPGPLPNIAIVFDMSPMISSLIELLPTSTFITSLRLVTAEDIEVRQPSVVPGCYAVRPPNSLC